MRKYIRARNKASKSCAFSFSQRKRERARAKGVKEEEGTDIHKTLFKKKDQTQESERRVLSPVTEKTPKKTIHRLERERKRERGGTLGGQSSHFTRTHNFIMALRQTLKQFTSKTTAFAPLLSRASGVQMYSTVIEGLKYASSHEWYVHRNSHPLFFRSELSPFVLFGNTFFCFLSLYPFLICIYIRAYTYRCARE